mgnify:CR=1 FL=1
MTDNHTSPAALIAVDWGTSSLRAWLLDADGQVLDARRSDQGLMQVANSDFAGTYHALVHDWVRAHGRCPAIACGMIGSQGGWHEVPYIETPAAPASLAERLAVIDTEAGAFHIVPGVMQAPAAGRLADVMRGEETQSLGALALDPTLAASARLITPGTHSKWITVEDGRLGTFATYMTGELYALLTAHSILGRPAQACAETPDPAAFDLGVGWNLVPVSSMSLATTTIDADDYFSGLTWSRAYGYSNSDASFNSILPTTDAVTSAATVSVSQGYWLYLTKAGTLVP